MSLQDIYRDAKSEEYMATKYCVVGIWGHSLVAPNDRKAFEDSIGDDDLSHRALFNIYQQAGATFGLTSLKEHRNGNCKCL